MSRFTGKLSFIVLAVAFFVSALPLFPHASSADTAHVNYVSNPGFETANTTGWSEWHGAGLAQKVEYGGQHAGSYKLVHYNAAAYTQLTSQVKSVPNGKYTLSVYIRSAGGQNALRLFAKNFGGSGELQASVGSAAVSSWKEYVIDNIKVTNGQIEFGVWSDASAGNWAAFDDFVLTRNLAANPGFESAATGWSEWHGAALAQVVQYGGQRTGSYKLVHTNASAFTQLTYQTVQVPNGTYRLSVWFRSAGGQKALRLYAKNYGGGAELQANVGAAAVSAWTPYVIDNIPVTNGQIEIGVWSDANAGNWAAMDDFSLTPKWNSVQEQTTTPPPDDTGGSLAVGQSRTLTDSQIQSLWNGIDPQYSPGQAAAAVQAAISQSQYEALFPYRIGSPAWHEFARNEPYYKPGQPDYYSYANLIAAVSEVANIKYKIQYREGATWLKRLYRLDKAAKRETFLYDTPDFDASWNQSKPLVTKIVDFGTFIKEGTSVNRKRELAAFLAQISHETTGGGEASPGGPYRWGLFWNEEVAYINSTNIGYVVSDTDYPPAPGKSYHGRGPIQLSYNYNYGLFSSIIYGDKNILLQQPEKVTEDGKLGFMTGILFWMTPQPPKPSCHDVIVGNWIPNQDEIAKGLTPPGFGVTTMVINGGLEGNKDLSDPRVANRVGFYKDFAGVMGLDVSGEKLDTQGMYPW